MNTQISYNYPLSTTQAPISDELRHSTVSDFLANTAVISFYKKWSLRLALLLLTSNTAFAASVPATLYTAGSGKVWSSPFTASASPGDGAWVTPTLPSQAWAAYFGNVQPSTTGINNCLAASAFSKLSNQDVTGFRLANDVLLVIEAGTMTGYHYVNSSLTSSTYTVLTGVFGANGVFSSNNSKSTTPWCLSASDRWAGARLQKTLPKATVANGVISLYVGPEAAYGSVAVPSIYFGIRANTSYTRVLTPSTIRIGPPTDCTLAFQDSNVAFGTVNNQNTDKQVIAVHPSQLNVQCASVNDNGSGTNRATVNLAFAGDQGRTPDTLALKDTADNVLAEIRAIRAVGISNCNDNNSNQVMFDNQPIELSDIAVGANPIPLTWVLCSNGSRQYGNGTAQATAVISWP
ncbi:hypothetical protein [Serratia microhaemolytica]|uniref:hypothetical protein n=1 Tax=Serratia microhaemolytica TaxID=2675110 RepID=UPI000FDCEF22|nr:hypothetical protein [Serratia microhaemolytica]